MCLGSLDDQWGWAVGTPQCMESRSWNGRSFSGLTIGIKWQVEFTWTGHWQMLHSTTKRWTDGLISPQMVLWSSTVMRMGTVGYMSVRPNITGLGMISQLWVCPIFKLLVCDSCLMWKFQTPAVRLFWRDGLCFDKNHQWEKLNIKDPNMSGCWNYFFLAQPHGIISKHLFRFTTN